MSTGCGGSLFSVRYFPNGSPFCLPEIRTSDNERDMDKIKICEAMYALPGGVVVKRRKSQLRAAVLFIAGVALVVVNNMYGAELTNNMRSAIVFIGGLLILSGMVMAAIQLFGSGGVPFHKDKHCYLVFEELYFDRGGTRECPGAHGGPLPYARQQFCSHAGVRVRRPGVQAADQAEHSR